EMHDFIDTPVQNYSSGMKVRLGFAVAIQMEPDILIIDEVLAVGDLGFRIKCFNEIYKIIESAAVILVSHSMPQVNKISNLGILLSAGKIINYSKDVSEVILSYYNQFGSENASFEGSKRAQILQFKFGNQDNLAIIKNVEGFGNSQEISVSNDQKVIFEADVLIDEDIKEFTGLISISDVDQKVVSQITPNNIPYVNDGTTIKVKVQLESLMLNTGSYTISIHFFKVSSIVDRGEAIIGIRNAMKFSVKNSKFLGAAPILYTGKWEIPQIKINY
ncbi:MAG: Wzt carbohydrate-binding domain-containing protein, partial [Bacteroidota bacterium]|nr:Wzt carbohydrate-binding domain-containing protein [Bacteroidota bacterium]